MSILRFILLGLRSHAQHHFCSIRYPHRRFLAALFTRFLRFSTHGTHWISICFDAPLLSRHDPFAHADDQNSRRFRAVSPRHLLSFPAVSFRPTFLLLNSQHICTTSHPPAVAVVSSATPPRSHLKLFYFSTLSNGSKDAGGALCSRFFDEAASPEGSACRLFSFLKTRIFVPSYRLGILYSFHSLMQSSAFRLEPCPCASVIPILMHQIVKTSSYLR